MYINNILQTGSHDHSRVGSDNRYGSGRVNALNTILLTLPDTSITYYVRISS